MAACYLSLNRDAEALALAEETAAQFERRRTPTEASRARFYSALAEMRLGNVERALHLFEAAAQSFAAAGLSSYVGLATLQRARLYLEEADWPAALREAERAEASFAERGLAVRRAQAQLVQAQARLALDQFGRAARLARSALAVAQEREVLWLAPECHHVLARIAEGRRELGQALGAYQAAVAGIESIQSRLATELRTNFLADKLAVFHDAIRCSLRLGQPDLAFRFLERAKSRALVDHLAAHPDIQPRAEGSAGQELLADLARLREEHNWFYNQFYGDGLAGRPGADGPASEAETLPDALAASLRVR